MFQGQPAQASLWIGEKAALPVLLDQYSIDPGRHVFLHTGILNIDPSLPKPGKDHPSRQIRAQYRLKLYLLSKACQHKRLIGPVPAYIHLQILHRPGARLKYFLVNRLRQHVQDRRPDDRNVHLKGLLNHLFMEKKTGKSARTLPLFFIFGC